MWMGLHYLPELILGLLILINLFQVVPKVRQVSVLLLFISIIMGITGEAPLISSPIDYTPWESWFRWSILSLTTILLWNQPLLKPEEFTLVAILGWSSSLMCGVTNFLELFLWMEIQTLTLFVLIARRTYSILSTEAGVKYFVLAAFVSGLFLFGVSLQYHYWGDFQLSHQDLNLHSTPVFPLALISTTLLFKMTVAPFHQWAPDVYEGSSWRTLIALASLPKLAIFSIIIKLGLPLIFFWIGGIASIIIGGIGAFNQVKLKRLMAYSAIGHSGFILLGISLGTPTGYFLAGLYLVLYSITFLCFGLIAQILLNSRYSLHTLGGLKAKYPLISFILVGFLFSMAGIPPLAGFLVKWGILFSLIGQGQLITALIALVGTSIAVGYYLRLVKVIYFEPQNKMTLWTSIIQKASFSWETSYTLSIGIFSIVTILILPWWLLDSLNWAAWCIV